MQSPFDLVASRSSTRPRKALGCRIPACTVNVRGSETIVRGCKSLPYDTYPPSARAESDRSRQVLANWYSRQELSSRRRPATLDLAGMNRPVGRRGSSLMGPSVESGEVPGERRVPTDAYPTGPVNRRGCTCLASLPVPPSGDEPRQLSHKDSRRGDLPLHDPPVHWSRRSRCRCRPRRRGASAW